MALATIYHVPDMPVCLIQEESRYIRCIFTVFQVFGHQKSVCKFDLSLFSRSLYPIYNVQKGLVKRLGQQNCVAKLDLSLCPRSLYPISAVFENAQNLNLDSSSTSPEDNEQRLTQDERRMETPPPPIHIHTCTHTPPPPTPYSETCLR